MTPRQMFLDELTEYVEGLGEKKFRAKQIFDWYHVKRVRRAEEMNNLPKTLREKLAKTEKSSAVCKEANRQCSSDGTIKFLFELYDGQMIETVFMKYDYGNSICISSQAGCRMGCKFCASTIGGLIRNLEAEEMLEEVYEVMRLTGERISNIVVMGTGEPLDNYDNLLRFIRLVTNENGYNLSGRNITVSSCGIVPGIKRLADEKLPITFALSLHAPSDEERKELMPIAFKYTLAETLDACRYYFDTTGRRITFEYSLVAGVNDTADNAERLAKLLKGMNCHVNLIPVNPIEEREYRRSSAEAVKKFKDLLEKKSINVTIRRSVGGDIDAACGQLRRKHLDIKEEN